MIKKFKGYQQVPGLVGAFESLEEVPWEAWPDSDQGEARGVDVAALTLAAIVSSSVPLDAESRVFLPAKQEQLEACGVSLRMLEANPRILRLFSEVPGLSAQVAKSEGDEPGDYPVHRESDQAVYLEGTQTTERRFVLKSPAGTVVLVTGKDGYRVQPVLQPIEIRALTSVEAPVSEWLTHSQDSWLNKTVADYLERGDSWSLCVGAGLFARLRSPEPNMVADLYKKLMNGERDVASALPREWARTLKPDQLRTMEALALSEIEWVHQAVEALPQHLSPDVERWEADWFELCHRRDDLEGVRLLLDEGGEGNRLAVALASLDREGKLLVRSLPRRDLRLDERMTRVAKADPAAWWSGIPSWHF
jgi:hypothetical protein